MSATYEQGYYWIKYYEDVWEVAEYSGKYWYRCGTAVLYDTDELKQIGHKLDGPT